MRRALRAFTLAAVALLAAGSLTGAARTDRVTTDWLPCPVTRGTDKQVRVTFELYEQTKSSPIAQPLAVEWRTPNPDILSGKIAHVRLLYVAPFAVTLGDHNLDVPYPVSNGLVWIPDATYHSAPIDHDPTAYVELYATDGTLNCRANPFQP